VSLSASDATVSNRTGGVTTTRSDAAIPSALRSAAQYSSSGDDVFDVLPAKNGDGADAEPQQLRQGQRDLEMRMTGAGDVKMLQAVYLEKH
jgi:hypothetical protein